MFTGRRDVDVTLMHKKLTVHLRKFGENTFVSRGNTHLFW